MAEHEEGWMQAKHVGALVVLALVWGAAFLFIKIAVAEIAPATLVAFRIGLAALLFCIILTWRGLALPRGGRTWAGLFYLGAFGVATPFLLITWAETRITSGMAAILIATTPLFTTVLSQLFLREERLAPVRLLGIAIGFVGVVVAVGIEQLRLDGLTWLGVLAAVGAALCYGTTNIYVRQAFAGTNPLIPATGQMLCGAAIMLPVALLADGVPREVPGWSAIAALLALTIPGTVLAYLIYYWLFDQIGASRTSMVSYLTPPIALFYGAAVLGEPLTVRVIAGLLLVLFGIVIASGMVGQNRRTAR